MGLRPRVTIDAQAIARLKDRVTVLNRKAVPVSEATIAAMELLCCGDERAMELAIQRGTGQPPKFLDRGSRSVPELVREALDRGAPFRYVLSVPPDLLALPNTFTRGWDRLDSCHRQLSPPPEGVDQREHAKVLKRSLFERSVQNLKEGGCLVLALPGSSMIMAARDAEGGLLMLTNKMSRGVAPPLQVYERQAVTDRLSQAMHLSSGNQWAMIVTEELALGGAARGESHA